MSGEFDGRQYGLGTVRGIRSFDIDEYGRLTGINYPAPWKPGENRAACYLGSYDPSLAQLYRTAGVPIPYRERLRPTTYKAGHSFARCSCGLYAYYDGSNDYKSDARISAVVEGYGEVMIGTRGFRAEKARIIALCIPTGGDRVRRRLDFFGRIAVRGAVGGCAGETGLTAVLRYVAGDPVSGTWLIAVAILALAGSFLMPIQWPQKSSGSGRLSGKQIALVRRNYPDVPVYGSFRAMVAAFPPDKGLEPSPETDPHFWDAR